MKKFFLTVLMILTAVSMTAFFSACGGGSDDNGDSQFVGTWLLSGGETPWYMHFREDGTWNITTEKSGAGQKVYGTYSVSGSTARGPMTNPRVGVGEIVATMTGKDSFDLDFIEHWHSPYKHVPYKGTKLK